MEALEAAGRDIKMDTAAIYTGLILAIIIAFWYIRKSGGRHTGGGKVSEKDSDGWTFTWNIQEKPLLIDVNTKTLYQLKAYKLITQNPLKVRARLETNPDVGSGLQPEVLDVYFEEGVNEPEPSHKIACCLFNKPGAWLFSQSGVIEAANPATEAVIENMQRQIAQLTKELNRTKSESRAEVKDNMTTIAKVMAAAKPQRGAQQQSGYP